MKSMSLKIFLLSLTITALLPPKVFACDYPFGTVRVVDGIADYNVRIVEGIADYSVTKVNIANECGEWAFTDGIADFTVHFVEGIADFTVTIKQ